MLYQILFCLLVERRSLICECFLSRRLFLLFLYLFWPGCVCIVSLRFGLCSCFCQIHSLYRLNLSTQAYFLKTFSQAFKLEKGNWFRLRMLCITANTFVLLEHHQNEFILIKCIKNVRDLTCIFKSKCLHLITVPFTKKLEFQTFCLRPSISNNF